VQDNTSGTAESGGPLDEIAFWASRTQDLSGISSQLSQPRLLAIVAVLREAKSSYLAPFDMLAKSIQFGLRTGVKRACVACVWLANCRGVDLCRYARVFVHPLRPTTTSAS